MEQATFDPWQRLRSCLRTSLFGVVFHVLFSFSGFAQLLNTLSPEEKAAGWQLLFDGKTMNGWGLYYDNTPKEQKWQIIDGTLHVIDRKEGWDRKDDLITEEAFGNFDLKIEWKVGSRGKSGILFFVQQDPSTYPFMSGLQMEVLDNGGYPERKNQKHWAGDLYDLIAGSPEVSKPAGEWNQAEIYCSNDTLRFFLNGANTLSTTLWNDNWFSLVQNAPNHKLLPFPPYASGKIDLQDRGLEVWYRNIKIRKLPEARRPDIAAAYNHFTGNSANNSAGNSTNSSDGGADLAGTDSRKKLAGYWKIKQSSPALKTRPIFSNDYVELHENGVGISRNDLGNTTNNVRFFFWYLGRDTLYQLGKEGSITTYTFHPGQDGTISLSGTGGGNAMEATLQKISADPLIKYKDYLTTEGITGRWTAPIALENSGAFDTAIRYYDIHPSTNDIGEIICSQKNEDYDNLYFIKYKLAVNTLKQMGIDPLLLQLGRSSSSDTNAHYYSFDWMNYKGHEDVDAYVSDGIMILYEFGHWTYYLTRSGQTRWTNVATLHDQYNAHVGREILPPYGVHWAACPVCGGSGKVIAGYDDVYSHTNAAGYSVYDKKERYGTCSQCNGTGGAYVSDTPE